MTKSKNTTTRWWPLFLIWIFALLALAYFVLTSDINRQDLVMRSIGTGIGVAVLSVMWLLSISRLPWRTRLKGFFVVVLLGLVSVGLFRYEGVSGDLVPIVKWRWVKVGERVVTDYASASELVEGSYPQFLGPDRNAKVSGFRLDPDWKTHPPQLIWKKPIGEAWSAFAVVGNRAVTQEQDELDELVVCYELLTGKKLWEHRYPARYDNPLGGVGPRATPTIDGRRVFTLGAMGDLLCLDLETGKKLWGHNVMTKHGASLPDWGFAGSPLVHGDFLIISVGAPGGHSLVAYDKTTGDNFWRGGSGAANWSSPVLYDIAGRPQVLIFNNEALVAHDVSNGKILWEYPWFTDNKPHVAIPILLPGDRIILSSGYGKGAAMLQISPVNGKLEVKRLWKSLHLKAKFNNYIFKDGYVYGLDDGMLTCINTENGRRKWKQGRYGHGQNILVGDLMLLTSEQGKVLLLEPVPEEPRVLGSFQALDGKSWNPPVLVGEYLLVRNHLEAALYRLPILKQ